MFHESLTRMTGTLREDVGTFMIYRLILLIMRNVSDKLCRQIQNWHFCVQKHFFFLKSCRLWDNVGKHGRGRQATDDDIRRRWRFACWITKATNTHSKYVILIGFPRRKWLCERTSILRYTCTHSFVNIRGPLYQGFSNFLVQWTCYKGKGYPAIGRSAPRGSG